MTAVLDLTAANDPIASRPDVRYMRVMDGIWFRRWGGFGFIATCWQGWVATILTLIIAAPLGILFILLLRVHPVSGWACGIAMVAAMGAFFGLVFWKLEREYHS